MTRTDLDQCMHYDSTTLLCPTRSPIYHMQSDESLCKKKQESSGCRTKHESCQNTWLELSNRNNYLYFCCDACKIRVICGNQVSTALLNKAGVMSLGSDCTINSETFTIHSQRQFMDTLHAQIEELTLEIPPINRIMNLSVPILKHEPEDDTVMEQSSLLRDLGKQIEQMKAATAEDTISGHATYHDVHQYVVIYILATVAATASTIYAYYRLRRHCTKQEHSEPQPVPNPAPRRRSTASIVDYAAVLAGTDDNSAVHLSSARALNKATSPIARCDLIV